MDVTHEKAPLQKRSFLLIISQAAIINKITERNKGRDKTERLTISHAI